MEAFRIVSLQFDDSYSFCSLRQEEHDKLSFATSSVRVN